MIAVVSTAKLAIKMVLNVLKEDKRHIDLSKCLSSLKTKEFFYISFYPNAITVEPRLKLFVEDVRSDDRLVVVCAV